MLGQEKKSRQKYPRKLKIRVAEEVVSGLKGPAEASRDYGISVDTVRPWIKKYRNQILAKETALIIDSSNQGASILINHDPGSIEIDSSTKEVKVIIDKSEFSYTYFSSYQISFQISIVRDILHGERKKMRRYMKKIIPAEN